MSRNFTLTEIFTTVFFNRINKKNLMICLVLLSSLCLALTGSAQVVTSPDTKTVMEVRVNPSGKLEYQVRYNNVAVLNWSALGLNVNGIEAGNHTQILHTTSNKHTEI